MILIMVLGLIAFPFLLCACMISGKISREEEREMLEDEEI